MTTLMRETYLNCRFEGKKIKPRLLSHYFLLLFTGISTFTTKVSRIKMCCMCRTLWMELPPYSLTRMSYLKMALWHWRVSHIHWKCHYTHLPRQLEKMYCADPSFSLLLSPPSGPSVWGVWIFCIWFEQQWFRLGNSAFHESWWPHPAAWCSGEG